MLAITTTHPSHPVISVCMSYQRNSLGRDAMRDCLMHEGIEILNHSMFCQYVLFLNFRLILACGGLAMNSFDDLGADCLGHAGLVYEHVLVCDILFITLYS